MTEPVPQQSPERSPQKSPPGDTEAMMQDDSPDVQNSLADLQTQLNTARREIERLQAERTARVLADLTTADQPRKDLSGLRTEELLKLFPRPEKFSSTNKKVSIADWIGIFKQWLQMVQLPEATWGQIISNQLTDADKKVYLDHVQQITDRGDQHNDSWVTVTGTMITIWGDADPDTALLNKLLSCAQRGRTPQEYIVEFSSIVNSFSSENRPKEHTLVWFFTRNMDEVFRTSVGVNPATMTPWALLSDVYRAMRTKAALLKPQATQASSSHSGQKRRPDNTPSGATQKRPNQNRGSGKPYVPQPGTRNLREQKWLQDRQLCFHCVSKDPTVHQSKNCPHKNKPAAQMPKDFQ